MSTLRRQHELARVKGTKVTTVDGNPDGRRNQHLPSVLLPEVWGRDHWSTLAYIESRVVDHGGRLENQHLRVDPKLHIRQAHRGSAGEPYPTRLKGGAQIENHDDISCIEDMAGAGLVEEVEPQTDRRDGIWLRLTDKGWRWAHTLRRFMGEGGTYAGFTPPGD